MPKKKYRKPAPPYQGIYKKMSESQRRRWNAKKQAQVMTEAAVKSQAAAMEKNFLKETLPASMGAVLQASRTKPMGDYAELACPHCGQSFEVWLHGNRIKVVAYKETRKMTEDAL